MVLWMIGSGSHHGTRMFHLVGCHRDGGGGGGGSGFCSSRRCYYCDWDGRVMILDDR